jgi:eukaryotic-like serine/threonine-protein kinase
MLAPGVRLGPYEIGAVLGSGGMGQVYRARDVRLQREVALKVLHDPVASDPARTKRFEVESRAASALNHPNIVTIYDVGAVDSVAWIAMERLDGETLRRLTANGPLPIRRLLAIASQIADGLAKAHEAGIVHRDLKPENVIVSKEGLAKILDFGLAKLAPVGGDSAASGETGTFPGAVLGTVGYMSPEQAHGLPVDYRSDQFSFGSVLYEMATGKRAFLGRSPVDTLAAIIDREPEPIESQNPAAPGPLRWIVRRCLAKDPSERYASTQDLARDLKDLQGHLADVSGPTSHIPASPPRGRLPRLALAAAALIAALAAAYVLGRRAAPPKLPDFQRLTYGHGVVSSARFGPDGRTVVYSAEWDGNPARVFSTRTDGRESTRLDLPSAELLSVSSQGEMALRIGSVLARVPLTGGAPREMAEGVSEADWSPDGKTLAVVRGGNGKQRLEYPMGRTLYETSDDIVSPRVSPRGDRVAFLSPHSVDANVSVDTVDLRGRHEVLSRGWKRASHLAWSADGREIWFSANERAWRTPLYAATLSGNVHLVMRLPSWIVLQDVARDGRVLVSLVTMSSSIRLVAPGESGEKDYSWHESSFAKALTSDGKMLLFDEGGEGAFHTVYVRATDGSPAKRIGEGRAMAISPDGRWVATNSNERGSDVVLVPTGPGDSRILNTAGHRFAEATFLPDGKRILLVGDGGPVFVADLTTGKLEPVAPDGVECGPVSPDGKRTACTGQGGAGSRIYPIDGGAPRPVAGLEPEESVIQWSSDPEVVFAGAYREKKIRIVRLDLGTGRREPWREIAPDDPAALANPLYYFAMTPDGKAYAYSPWRVPSDLYLVNDLR